MNVIGNKSTRADLDSQELSFVNVFWNDVRDEFVGGEGYDNLVDEHALFEGISPSTVIEHSAPKLQSMWKELNAKYRKARINFEKSGTHDSDFSNFCFARGDILYLHCWLQV